MVLYGNTWYRSHGKDVKQNPIGPRDSGGPFTHTTSLCIGPLGKFSRVLYL